MKKKIILIGTLTAVFALGIGLTAFKVTNQTFNVVEAQQHIDNYSDYYYTGTYYDNTDLTGTYGLNGTLRIALTELTHPSEWYIYKSSGSDHLSTQLQYADEDPTNSSNMVYLYTRDSVKKNAASSWNREHVWPRSLSNGCWEYDYAGTDILHIRPTYEATNSARRNDKYGDTNKTGKKTITVGGVTMDYGWSNGSYFEPLDSVKGDVARIIMYIWTAYKNHYASLPSITNVFQSYDVLLKWHMQDRPDLSEGLRNNYCQGSKQSNRNPFVDHPEFAWKIFGENCSDQTIVQQCQNIYPDSGPVPRRAERLEISGDAKIKTYYAGDIFNPNGLKAMVYFNDATSMDVTSSATWTPNPLVEGTTSVTCTYQGASATYDGILVLRRPGDGGGSSEPDKKGANGCSGSIIGTTSAIGASALFGLAFIFLRKKKR